MCRCSERPQGGSFRYRLLPQKKARRAGRAFDARSAGRKSGTSGTKVEIGQNRPQSLMNTGFAQSGGTGTGKLDGVKVETVTQLLKAFEAWIRLQGFSQRSPQDHRQKVSRFFTFVADRGLVDDRGRIELNAIDQEVIADYQAHLL